MENISGQKLSAQGIDDQNQTILRTPNNPIGYRWESRTPSLFPDRKAGCPELSGTSHRQQEPGDAGE